MVHNKTKKIIFHDTSNLKATSFTSFINLPSCKEKEPNLKPVAERRVDLNLYFPTHLHPTVLI